MSPRRRPLLTLLLLPALAGFASPPWVESGAWPAWIADAMTLMAARPLLAATLFFVFHAALSAVALPGGAVMLLLAGAAWGVPAGGVLCMASCTLGATIAMLAARHGLRPVIVRRWGRQVTGVERRLRDEGIWYLFALRMAPVLPFVAVNLAFGLTAIRTWTFAWVSAAGMALGTLAYVNAGAALAAAHGDADPLSPRLWLALALLGVLPLLVRRWLSGRGGISA